MRAHVAALLLLVACGDDTTTPGPDPLAITPGCNPIGARLDQSGDCLLPYPSDFYRTDDGSGFRVVLPEPAQIAFEGTPRDVLAFHRPDGFSVGSPILAHLAGPIDPSGLIPWTGDVEATVSGASSTLLVDAETGERVLHFAELDPRAPSHERQALILRPLVRLEAGRRYVVGIRELSRSDGSGAVPPPEGFRSLRDEAGKAHPDLEALSTHYDAAVFPLLEAAGAARGELTLAWDFTTRSEDDARGDLLAIRSDVMDRSASAPPAVAVVSSSEDVDAHIARRVELTVDVPLYLSQAEPGGTLNGSPPVASETIAVPVTVWIPRSVADRAPGDPPARLLQYGHGFFGGRVEADGFPAELADEHGFVIVAADWWGLSNEDQSFVAGLVVSDPANVMLFTDRLHQAFANFLTLSEAAVGPIAALPELEVNGAPAYDPGQLYFYGISMGHILGSTFVALSPRVERAVVSVGGANFSMMLFRARPFLPLLALLQTQLDDPLDQQKFAALAQSAFDRIDPLSYAPSTLRDTLPGSPASRQLLMHTGVADSEVPNVTSYFHARILGLPTLVPASPLVPSGLGEVSAPTGGSALTVFDFGIAPETLAQPASEPTPVHEGVRRLEASRLQVSTFLSPNGEIIDPCSGPCDPE